jgi:hypothetical protein
MKKLFLVPIFALIVNCTTEKETTIKEVEKPKPTCLVEKYTLVRDIDERTSPWTIGEWKENGSKEFYSNNCDDCGKEFPGYSGRTDIGSYEIKYVNKCK